MNNKNNKPWESPYSIWNTEAEFFTYLRSALRKAVWNLYPIKLKYKNVHVSVPPPDYKGRAKSGAYCALSGEWVAKSKLQVDHKLGNVSLRTWDDILPFIEHLLLCDNNLQLVSSEAHKIKSYAERMGITYEEAEIEKKHIIPFKKLSAAKQKEIIFENNPDFAGEKLTTQDKRVKVYRELIKEK